MTADHPTSRARGIVMRAIALATAFLVGGTFVPRIVEATTSTGNRAIFEPVAPARILDTRFGPSPLPVGTQVGPGGIIEIAVVGQGGVAADATAVVLNVTVSGATVPSHLTVYPAGDTPPDTSSLNFGPGDIIPNSVTVKIGAAGKVAIRNNSGSVHVVADVNGYYRGHNHDDRYDTKAQVSAKVAAGIATANHVTTAQILDHTITSNDLGSQAVDSVAIKNGSVLWRTDLPAYGFVQPYVTLSIANNACVRVGFSSPPGPVPGNVVLIAPQTLTTMTNADQLTSVVTRMQVPVNQVLFAVFCNYSGATISGSGGNVLGDVIVG
jgi:hypothetical protein